jgi:hypothetical protein
MNKAVNVNNIMPYKVSWLPSAEQLIIFMRDQNETQNTLFCKRPPVQAWNLERPEHYELLDWCQNNIDDGSYMIWKGLSINTGVWRKREVSNISLCHKSVNYFNVLNVYNSENLTE